MHLKPCSKPEFLCNTTGWANLARPVCVRVRDFQLAALDATQKPARLCFPLGQDFLQARICAVSPTFSVLVYLETMKNKPSRWNLCNNNQDIMFREVVFFWQARFRRNVVQTLHRSIFCLLQSFGANLLRCKLANLHLEFSIPIPEELSSRSDVCIA